jgi:cysteine synthase A
MRLHQIAPSVIEALLLPHVIRMAHNFYATPFFLMKLLPAYFILERARAEGLIAPGTMVIETTSGTFGLALAIVCRLRGYRLMLVSDPAIDPPLQRRLEDLGTTVEIVREPNPVGGFQRARLDRMAQLQAVHPGHFCPSQYDNPHNPESYAQFAELLTETVGQVDYLVGAVGSGGSMCGTSSYLRLLFPHLRAVGVDTHGSVLFGQPDAKKRLLRGLGNSLMPANLNHSLFDDVHWVNAAEAFTATRLLHQQHALYMGPTSGATYMVARWYAQQHPRASVVAIFPDEGYRYENNVYDDEWLRASDVWLPELPVEPQLVNHPLEVGAAWSVMNWKGRTYEEVMGASFRQ